MTEKEATMTKQLPATIDTALLEEDAGEGFENATSDSYAIPFLLILQSLSPQCKKTDGAYIKGAEEGMLFNTVTQELFDGDKGVDVIPCYYRRVFLQWAPRESGGGFRGEHLPSDPMIETTKTDALGRNVLPNGDLLVDTRVHYVLLLRPDGFSPAVVSLSSTQVKKSKQWMSKMQDVKMKNAAGVPFTPPMFSHVYQLTTTPESNDKGSWYGLKVVMKSPVVDPVVFAAAKEFKRQISSGEVREQTPQAAHATDTVDEDVPF